VFSKDLIGLSDSIQQMAPQAICCKLYGFQTSRTNFTDAENNHGDSENKENSLGGSTNSSMAALNDDEDLIKASNLLVRLLSNKPFMATAYKRFCVSKKIDNRLPLQTDNNAKPIEVVIHLFQPNELDVLGGGESSIDEINENKEDLKFRNACYLVKHLLGQNRALGESSVSVEKYLAAAKEKINDFDLDRHLDENMETTVAFG